LAGSGARPAKRRPRSTCPCLAMCPRSTLRTAKRNQKEFPGSFSLASFRVFSGQLVLLAAFLSLSPAAAATRHEADTLFGLTNLWTLHLKISAADWAAMRPNLLELSQHIVGFSSLGLDFPPPPVPPDGPPLIDFKVVPATLEFESKTYEKIGL